MARDRAGSTGISDDRKGVGGQSRGYARFAWEWRDWLDVGVGSSRIERVFRMIGGQSRGYARFAWEWRDWLDVGAGSGGDRERS
jgi:hypothetical protein